MHQAEGRRHQVAVDAQAAEDELSAVAEGMDQVPVAQVFHVATRPPLAGFPAAAFQHFVLAEELLQPLLVAGATRVLELPRTLQLLARCLEVLAEFLRLRRQQLLPGAVEGQVRITNSTLPQDPVPTRTECL